MPLEASIHGDDITNVFHFLRAQALKSPPHLVLVVNLQDSSQDVSTIGIAVCDNS